MNVYLVELPDGEYTYCADNPLCKIYLKWFELGFNEHIKCLHNPNRWLGVSKAFDIDYDYEATFVESLPWNNRWTWRGYRDGYYFVDSFNYANKMPDESCIREFFNSRRCKKKFHFHEEK